MTDRVTDLLEPVPDWVLAGWYGNNPDRQQFAIARYRTPVCTAAERDAARAYVRETAFPCEGCGKFSFAAPTRCFWCRQAAASAVAA